MNVVILNAGTGWHTGELRRALTLRGHTSDVLPYEAIRATIAAAGGAADLTNGSRSLLSADAVLPRIVPGGSLDQIIFRVDALHWIENRGVLVVNSPRAIERSVDKFYTTTLIHDAGLPTPETVVCERMDDALAAVRMMGDAIVKPLFGSLGHGMVRLTDPEVASRVLESLEAMHAVFYVQRTVDHGGRDVRVFVIGGRVAGAIERRAPHGDWRTNVARGGSAEPVALPPDWERLALEAARVVGADYAGVDLLPSADGGVVVLEVSGMPVWQGLPRATGIDVAAAIVAHLERRAEAASRASTPAGLEA